MSYDDYKLASPPCDGPEPDTDAPSCDCCGAPDGKHGVFHGKECTLCTDCILESLNLLLASIPGIDYKETA